MTKELHDYCTKRIKVLGTIIKKAEVCIKDAPGGSLRVSRCNHTDQYYWKCDNSGKNGIYIKRSEEGVARSLAQKEYATTIRKVAMQQKRLLEKCVTVCNGDEIQKVYQNLPSAKQYLITPYLLSDEDYRERWQQHKQQEKKRNSNVEAGGMNLYILDAETGIMTESGILVRSKSEKIIADKLYMMGIPFIYENPLNLKGYGYVKPDFTVLNVRTREVFYWEHFGMMNIPQYAEKAVKKINTYERNGILQGRKLILTYETTENMLSIKSIERIIQEFLK